MNNNAIFSGYCFCRNPNTWRDFHICIRLPSIEAIQRSYLSIKPSLGSFLVELTSHSIDILSYCLFNLLRSYLKNLVTKSRKHSLSLRPETFEMSYFSCYSLPVTDPDILMVNLWPSTTWGNRIMQLSETVCILWYFPP